MQLTVLGKYGPYPLSGGGTSSYLVTGSDTAVALDFGSGALGRLQKVLPLTRLDAIVLTHLHLDHISDLLPLVYALGDRTLNLYLPLTDGITYDLISSFDCFNLIPIFNRRQIKIKGLNLEFYQMQHPVESYAVKISDGERALFYSGDTVFHDKIVPNARDCDLLLLDCAQPSSAVGTPHMTLGEGALIAKATGKRVLVTHVHPQFPPYIEARELGLEVVEEGARYKV